jgi:L-ascorbate metabolism protein UlaG (beta-lactamase superfamily)
MKTVFEGVTISFFGHASVALECSDGTVYIDPYVLPPKPKAADVVLFTHGHHDHCVDPRPIMKVGTVVIGPDGCKYIMQSIKAGDRRTLGNIAIEALPAYNLGKPYHKKGTGVGYIITLCGKKFYHAGDTDLIPEMSSINADVAFLPIGGTFTMNVEEATEAARTIHPTLVIPIHYNYIADTSADPYILKRALEPGIKVEILGD